MAVTHTFLDAIPSIFLGAPDASTALAVLPGHKLLLEGKGYEAVLLTVIGSLGSLILAISVLPLMDIFIPTIYQYIKDYIAYILITASILLIVRERKARVWAFIIFLMAGILGMTTLTFPNLNQPLFPLLSGLFGTSTLLLSIQNNTKIPKQEITNAEINKREAYKVIPLSVLIGAIASFMPGLGPSQAAIIGSQALRKISQRGFLILIGGLNTVNMIVSFIALYTLNKARNGAVVTISKILESITLQNLILFVAVSLIAGGIATFLTLKFTKIFSRLITKVNYKTLVLSITSLIFILVLIISGIYGILILVIGTFIGIIPAIKNIGKNHLMGSLMLPIILFFLL